MFEASSTGSNDKFYSILKYDYKEAVEQQGNLGQRQLRRIVEAFVADKKALQKSALIRVTNGIVSNDVASIDRMGKGADLTDYFTSFLSVTRTRSDEELNRNLVELLRQVYTDRKDDIPNQNVAQAILLAKDSLRLRQNIDNQAVLDAITIGAGNPHDPQILANLTTSTNSQLRKHRLSGITFSPHAATLARPSKKRVQTVEGITIEYPSNLEGRRVTKTVNANGVTFTIETARVENETVIRN